MNQAIPTRLPTDPKMNSLKLGFEVADSGLVDCFFPLVGDFVIYVDDRVVGGPELAGGFPLVVPTTTPITMLIDDRVCMEECCPGLWATACASGDTIIWRDFRSEWPRPTDLPPETVFRFSIDDYRRQIASAKAQLEEIENLTACPDFQELTEKLSVRLISVNLEPRIDWLMADDLIRNYNKNWIRCHGETGDAKVAADHYEMLRKTRQSITITLTPHPCFDRTMALLEGCPIDRDPFLTLRFARHRRVGIPVRSPLKWTFLRLRFGINQPQRGLIDYKLPYRQSRSGNAHSDDVPNVT